MQILKDYLSKVNANVQQVGRHGTDQRSEEWTKGNMTPKVSTDSVLPLQIKSSNKGQISGHPSEKGQFNDQQIS